MAAQVDDGLDYRRLPGDGSPPETAHTLPFGFRLARRMRRSMVRGIGILCTFVRGDPFS
jgi:hypothetical protein